MRGLTVFNVILGVALLWSSPVLARQLTGISFDGANGTMLLDFSEPVSPRVEYLSHPDRVVLDFSGTQVGRVQSVIERPEMVGVRRVRSGQYMAGTARVVLDLDGRRRYTCVTLGKRIELRPLTAGGAVPKPAAPVVSKARRLTELARQHMRVKRQSQRLAGLVDDQEKLWGSVPAAPLTLKGVRKAWQLRLMAEGDYRHDVVQVNDTRVMVTFRGSRIALPRDSVYIDNGLIARVRVVQSDARQAQLVIDFDKPVQVQHRRLGDVRALLLSMVRLERDRVTLDPGHGGEDNGAIGTAGTREKDVTLRIAERLSRLMERHGMSVQMTRMRDLEILLRPRVEMANRDESDVFVSIHANSMGRHSEVRGIETYYYSDESYPLARAIHRQLVAQLKQPDRGVRKNNFYVVHHTRMPAALVEIGYLSNPQEEALIRDPAYQERAAQAIFAGVQTFLRERGGKQ